MKKIFVSSMLLVLVSSAFGQNVKQLDNSPKLVTPPSAPVELLRPRANLKNPIEADSSKQILKMHGTQIDLQPAIPKGQFKSLGGVNGGGGDEVGLDFQQAFFTSLRKSQGLPENFYQKLAPESLAEVIDQISVYVTDENVPVKVQNFIQNSVAYNEISSKQILINRMRWNAIQDSAVKEAVALHEILSLKGVERTGYYPVSARYLSLVGGDSKRLEQILDVDRMKQAMARLGDWSKAQIVQELYLSAVAADINDIPLLSKSLSTWGGCAAFHPNYSAREPLSLIIAKYYASVVDAVKVTPQDGPLFQTIPGDSPQKLVINAIHRSFFEGRNYRPTENDVYPEVEVYKDSKITSDSVSLNSYMNSPTGYTKLSIKKDSQYLYAQVEGSRISPTIYAYCWKK
ncbi:MAG: hypothetical protein ACK5V3_00305 [Bdellovibrionales bacterium]